MNAHLCDLCGARSREGIKGSFYTVGVRKAVWRVAWDLLTPPGLPVSSKYEQELCSSCWDRLEAELTRAREAGVA